MILFIWSIVAGAVGYLKRQRMAQWVKSVLIDNYMNGKQLILRRVSISSPIVQPWRSNGEQGTNFEHEPALLWKTDSSEVLLQEYPGRLEQSWWRIYDGVKSISAASGTDIVYFTAICLPKDGDQLIGVAETSGVAFDIESVCAALAWRIDGDQIAVLFVCSNDQFSDVVCTWVDGRIIFRNTFEVQKIDTETLSLDFIESLGFNAHSSLSSTSISHFAGKCNGTVVNGRDTASSVSKVQAITTLSISTTSCCSRGTVETVTTTAKGDFGNLTENAVNGNGVSRSSVLCSLEQLCLSDILAAKDLCRSLGTFEGDLAPDSGGQASVYYTCNRDLVDSGYPEEKTSPLAVSVPSLANSWAAYSYNDEMSNKKQATSAALSPLSVDVFSGVPDSLSMSVDHLSPCHGFNDRLLDRKWYSSWRCDSLDSSASGHVITRQPTRQSVSRSSSGSKRRSGRHTTAKKASDSEEDITMPIMSRRWSLPSPPQYRSRAFSISQSKFLLTPTIKPPNILIYCGEDDSNSDCYSRLASVISRSVHPEKFIVYRLKRSRFLTDPWPNNAVCVILADTGGLDDRCWQRLFDYFKCGGKMFFICENRLLASLNDVGSTKKRYGLLKLAFGNNQQSKNQKDFNDFLKRLSRELRKPSINEHFNVLAADGRPRFTLSFVREESTPLILFMQNSQDRAVALFSDVTLDSVMTAGRSLIYEILQRLGLDLAGSELPSLSCGYLIFEETSRDDLAEFFLTLGRIDDGRTSIEFFHRNAVPPDRVVATRVYLPIWVNSDHEEYDFDEDDYFKHLKSERIGRCVLYVPVATSTMNYFEGLLARLPDRFAIVAIARYQLEGQGRGGNRFLSPDGCAMFTIGLRIPLHCRLAQSPGYVQHLLALAAVDSICSYREELENFHLRLKWPNDIYYGIGRMVKIGGVLVNCLARSDTLFFIAGLGLNISNSHPTICVNDLLPPNVPAFRTEQIIALTLTRFEKLMDHFERRGHDGILPLYYKYWIHNHQEITLAENRERVAIRGLDKRGYLEVRSRQTGRVFSLQPDGNSFDMMHNLIKIKE